MDFDFNTNPENKEEEEFQQSDLNNNINIDSMPEINNAQNNFMNMYNMNNEIDEEEQKRINQRQEEANERRKKIEEKINYELKKKEELREKAVKYLNDFMNERAETIDLKKKENKKKEEEFLNNKKLLKEGKLNSWEVVTEQIAMKDSEYKGSKEVQRMREVIINRKNDLKNNES